MGRGIPGFLNKSNVIRSIVRDLHTCFLIVDLTYLMVGLTEIYP